MSEVDIDGIPTLVYETSSKADFDKGGVTLESYTGNLFIQYQVDEVRRVSDLAKLSTELSDTTLNTEISSRVTFF